MSLFQLELYRGYTNLKRQRERHEVNQPWSYLTLTRPLA